MMQAHLQESQVKLQQNSQNSQVQQHANAIFKTLKGNFEGVKEVIARIEERKVHQAELAEMQKLMQQKQQKPTHLALN